MASISLSRPARHTVLRSFAGHLEASPDSVFDALAAHFGTLTGGEDGTCLTDPATRTVVVQGNWWYRGEYTVLPDDPSADDLPANDLPADDTGFDPTGSRIEYEIVNVAPTWHSIATLVGRRELNDAPHAFQALLSEIG